MPRNMIEANKVLFNRLSARVPQDTTDLLLGDVRRWIITNDEEKDFLKHCHYKDKVLCLPGKPVMGITYDNRFFVVLPITSMKNDLFMRGMLRKVSDNAGLLTVLWGECDYPFSELPEYSYRLAQDVFGTQDGYDFKTIKPFFMENEVWEIDPLLYDLSGYDYYRIYGGILSSEPNQLSLPYSIETLAKIRAILEDSMSKILGQMIFHALTSTHWEHSFLDFYRCVELFYSVPYCSALSSSLDLALGELELSETLENILNWHPREDEALTKLLSVIEDDKPELIDRFSKTLSTVATPGIKTSHSVAKAIYKLRNGIAHGRKIFIGQNSTLNWNEIVDVMCDLILELRRCFPLFEAAID